MNKSFFYVVILIFLSCEKTSQETFQLPFEKFTLDNGLEVILHEDHSDPIVALATVMHVGSSREKRGKTGFAHFFEHMSFNDSENVPRGSNRKMIPELGGSRNGYTTPDRTVYYEVVPKDAFEKLLWIDSDRLGFMINTVTESALNREIQVVKNEKRERTDNRAYGHTGEVIKKYLYPDDHPYSWTVIGSLDDLQSATLKDVKEFYSNYYGPNNASLVIAGDIDIKKTKELVKYWFGEIKKGTEVEAIKSRPVSLESTRSYYHIDNFAKLPELRIVFPTVEEYHKDMYSLDILGELLSASKNSPLYQTVVEEKKLAPRVSSYNNSMEIAGEFIIRIRANTGKDLDSIKLAIDEGFKRFERDGFSDKELERIKAKLETDLYRSIENALDKAFRLAIDNEFAGDPTFLIKRAKLTQAVTRDDIKRVYNKYIKDKHYLATSFVPKGQQELIIDGSELAEVMIEKVAESGAKEDVSSGEEAVYEKTITINDRSEPKLSEAPLFKMPDIWEHKLENGLKILGIENNETPLVNFEMTLSGGHLLDPMDKAGVASFLADLLKQGTKNKTAAELEEAIDLLGASIQIYADKEDIIIRGNALAKNFLPALELVEEILLEPRWDKDEFSRLKLKLKTELKDLEANANAISQNIFAKLLYGEEHILGMPTRGTFSSISNITLEDLKSFYQQNFSPSITAFHLAGNLAKADVIKSFTSLNKNWEAKDISFPNYQSSKKKLAGDVYFIDLPGSKQSVILLGYLALTRKDDDWNNLDYTNQIIGGGSSGRLFQLLRIEKGYTYGAYSRILSSLNIAPYSASTSVRANVTLKSLNLISDLYKNYKTTFTEKEVELTKNKVIKGNTRSYESLSAKIYLLKTISKYDLDTNYLDKEQNELMGMTLSDFHTVIDKYMSEDQMIYVIVGDKKTQLQDIKLFKKNNVIQLDIHGNKI
jgi:zinc protease